MISYQWIKLYIETLHDPKMGKLSDRLWRRAVECFMLAGELGNGGELPPIDKMAWTLRATVEQLETEFFNLCETGILSQVDGVYFVTSFSKRQAKIDGADRIKNYRERKKKLEYYEDETEVKRDGNEGVTTCYTDKNRIDIDKIKNRVDIDIEDDDNFATLSHAFVNAVGQPTNNETHCKGIAKLLTMDTTPEEVESAVAILSGKEYTISSPFSLVTTINNMRLQVKHKKEEATRDPHGINWDEDI